MPSLNFLLQFGITHKALLKQIMSTVLIILEALIRQIVTANLLKLGFERINDRYLVEQLRAIELLPKAINVSEWCYSINSEQLKIP